jgi:hypothetical protein
VAVPRSDLPPLVPPPGAGVTSPPEPGLSPPTPSELQSSAAEN